MRGEVTILIERSIGATIETKAEMEDIMMITETGARIEGATKILEIGETTKITETRTEIGGSEIVMAIEVLTGGSMTMLEARAEMEETENAVAVEGIDKATTAMTASKVETAMTVNKAEITMTAVVIPIGATRMPQPAARHLQSWIQHQHLAENPSGVRERNLLSHQTSLIGSRISFNRQNSCLVSEW